MSRPTGPKATPSDRDLCVRGEALEAASRLMAGIASSPTIKTTDSTRLADNTVAAAKRFERYLRTGA